ncbi:MAG: hypothetical protein GY772_27990, partial [bacterium]|nr:hypothetical protein [bacterium]
MRYRNAFNAARVVLRLAQHADSSGGIWLHVAHVCWKPLRLTFLRLLPAADIPDLGSVVVTCRPARRFGQTTLWWMSLWEVLHGMDPNKRWCCDFWTFSTSDGTETGALCLVPFEGHDAPEWWGGGPKSVAKCEKRRPSSASAPLQDAGVDNDDEHDGDVESFGDVAAESSDEKH